MKKHLLRSIFTLLLAALLMIGIPQTALAAPIEKTYTVQLANGIDEEIHSPDGSWIDDVVVVSGELPYGVVVGHKEDIMYIIGVPAYAGTYEARVDMEIGGGAYQYLIRIIVQDPNAPVTITKHPTGETVTEGGSAVFISRADNATEIVWRLVSPDTKTTYECKDASKYFPGLEVLGLGTDTLILKNIPYALDGWKAEAKFFGKDGPVFSNGARITVNRSELQMPVISIQPQGAELQQGASVTLSVSATAPEGSLRYQWYRAETDASDGIAISGAESASLLVNDTLGSGYYYVGVWCRDGDRFSQMLLSDIAVVTFTAPEPTPEVTPPPTETPVTETDPPSPTVPSPTAAPPAGQTAPARDNSSLLLILAAVGCAAALGVCILMIVKRSRGR